MCLILLQTAESTCFPLVVNDKEKVAEECIIVVGLGKTKDYYCIGGVPERRAAMYVHEYMQTKVVTVSPDTPIEDGEKMMSDFNIRRLPVVENGKLVGLVTKHRLKRLELSGATRMKDIMVKNPVTVTPDTMIVDVALLGQERQIGTFPVVDHGKLVGIMTATDIFNLQAQALGFGKPGLRLHLYDCCEGWRLRNIIEIALSHKATIRGLYRLTSPATEREETILFLDAIEGAELLNDLRGRGYVVEARFR